VVALIVTLGILRQRADFESMLLTRRDEMEAAIQNRIENGTVQTLRNQYQTDFFQMKSRVDTVQSSLEVVQQSWLIPLNERIKQVEKQNGIMPPASSERTRPMLPEDDL
jgi:hypothetical protein